MEGSSKRGFDGGSDVIGGVEDVIGFTRRQETKCGICISANEETSEETLAHPLYTFTARELLD